MKKIRLCIIALSCFCASLQAELVKQDLDYTDGLEEIDNPYIGFYRPVVKHFKVENNEASNSWGNLTHMRMDISEFSSNAVVKIDKVSGDTSWGVSQPLSEDMLNAFEAMLDGVRSRGKSAVVRFAYDLNYGGMKRCDPEQEWILLHLKQLGEVYSRNTDVINFIELGMYGSYGEMHTSASGSNANIAEALQTLLACTPPEIKIGVRRPDIVAWWLGVNDANNYSGFNIDSERFKQALANKGDTIFRVGMYNDGYLGSDSDLGTIGMGASDGRMTRELMVKWLNQYSQHTPYGGELVANYNGDHPINTPYYLSYEGFITHTSYLNYEWHQPTILAWKDSVMQNTDAEYEGCNGFTYVRNHLGYRFILRESLLPDSISSTDSLAIRLQIENVGFANLSQTKKVTFILADSMNIYELTPNEAIDPCQWKSRQWIENQTLRRDTSSVEATLMLPLDIEAGDYDLYIRLSEYGNHTEDNNLYCIQFGNTSTQFNTALGANKIGKIQIVDGNATQLKRVNSNSNLWAFVKNNQLHLSPCDELTIYALDGRILAHQRVRNTNDSTISLRDILEKTLVICLKSGTNIETFRVVNE